MSYRRPRPQPVENYTNAFFVTFGVLLFVTFLAIAAVAGFAWALLTAFAVDWVGTRLIRQRS